MRVGKSADSGMMAFLGRVLPFAICILCIILVHILHRTSAYYAYEKMPNMHFMHRHHAYYAYEKYTSCIICTVLMHFMHFLAFCVNRNYTDMQRSNRRASIWRSPGNPQGPCEICRPKPRSTQGQSGTGLPRPGFPVLWDPICGRHFGGIIRATYMETQLLIPD